MRDSTTPAAPDPEVQGRPKTLTEARGWMKRRLASRTHPMNALPPDEGVAWIDALPGLDGQAWGSYWGALGDRVRREAEAAEAAGDSAHAASLYQKASGIYFMGRFPCPSHSAKLYCAEAERETYLAASRHWTAPVQRHAIPFAGRPGEGREVVVLERRPPGIARPPAVLMWGGVDAWKEQMTAASDALLAQGVATFAMDNAGTGESPVRAGPDAHRVFLTAMEWLAQRSDLQGARIGLLGRSFGGLWATKLAHLVPERIAGAVNWGGGVHHMFQRDWIEASRHPDSYLMELVETRQRMLGATNDDEYIQGFAQLSLLDQDLLDRPCAPLLLVNGREDRQCPVADMQLLLDHGSPKTVRFFPGGHMGLTPQTLPTIVGWLARQVKGQGVQ